MKTKITALLLLVFLLLQCLPTPALAETDIETPERYLSAATDALGDEAELAGLKAYLVQAFTDCPAQVTISQYDLAPTAENIDAIRALIWYEIPELFHVKGIGFAHNGTKLVYINVSYYYTEAEYRPMLAACQAAADRMTADLKGSGLSDLQKALLLHDRLAVACRYDDATVMGGSPAEEAYLMYGALAEGSAVCQGYAYAYMFLLKQVGIESDLCASKTLNHAWNIVYLDGVAYHVDVTWDDPTYDRTGRVLHENFMLSSEALYNSGHTAADYDTTPAATTYDTAFWQNSGAEFQYLGGELYYIDSAAATLNRYSDQAVLRSLADVWISGYTNQFPLLSNDGAYLLYSLSDGIYRYDPIAEEAALIWQPDLSVGEDFAIFGFTYANGYLICDLYSWPSYPPAVKAEYQQTLAYSPLKVTDLTELLRAINGQAAEVDFRLLDRNGDGQLTLVDAFRILKLLSA